MGMFGSIIAFAILISVLVIVHELGHLIAARMNGVFVESFSVGYGKVLWEVADKKGTKWRLSMLPLGGYIKMFGDADVSSVKESIPKGYTEADMARMSIHRKKPWQKIIVAASGPLANFLFAIIVFAFFSAINGVSEYTSVISVEKDSVASFAGLQDGDTILKANSKNISTFSEFKEVITSSFGRDLNLEVKSQNSVKKISIKMYKEEAGKIVPIKKLGVAPRGIVYREISLLDSVFLSIKTTYTVASDNIKAIFQIIFGKMDKKDIGGVFAIFKAASDSAEVGIANFIWTLGMLSVMLGAVNLLPIPVLDGGTVLISSIEWIIRRPLNKKFVEAIFLVGLLIVASLMLLGIWNDLSRFKFFVFMENLFK